MPEISDFVDDLHPLWESEAAVEREDTIEFEVDIIELDHVELASILLNSDTHPDYFRGLSLDVIYDEASPPVAVIRVSNRVERSVSGFEQLREELGSRVITRRDEVAEAIEERNFQNLANALLDWVTSEHLSISVNGILDKRELGQSLVNNYDLNELPVNVWTSEDALESWLEDHRDIWTVVESLLLPNGAPIFLYFESEFEEEIGHIARFNIREAEEDLDEQIFDVSEQVSERYQTEATLLQAGGEVPAISPFLFSTQHLRRLFDGVFIYAIFAILSQETYARDGSFEFNIATDRGSISDQIDSTQLFELGSSSTNQQLSGLYSLYQEFVENGTRNAYRKLWHRAITSECGSFTEIIQSTDPIVKTYDFLEEEAIEGNFDDLSDAIEDAHSFAIDTAQNITERTTALTGEIQKVIFTILGAVLANLFLVIRWADVDMVLPFSIVAIVAILGLYFPIIESRVNGLDELIEEGNKDFEVYSETLGEFSGELFDFSKFEARRSAYIDYATRRKEWTLAKLEILFSMLTFVWIVFAVVSIIFYPVISGQFLIGSGSLVPALLIQVYHSKNEYYPSGFPPIIDKGPQTMKILISALVLTLLTLLLQSSDYVENLLF